MRLGEALNERAGLTKKIGDLRARITANVKVQEGETPGEDVATLIVEHNDAANALRDLTIAINKTNVATVLPDGRTLMEALADRERIAMYINGYDAALRAVRPDRFSGIIRRARSELRDVILIDVADAQEQIDAFAKARRELDATIQEINWSTDLIEE